MCERSPYVTLLSETFLNSSIFSRTSKEITPRAHTQPFRKLVIVNVILLPHMHGLPASTAWLREDSLDSQADASGLQFSVPKSFAQRKKDILINSLFREWLKLR